MDCLFNLHDMTRLFATPSIAIFESITSQAPKRVTHARKRKVERRTQIGAKWSEGFVVRSFASLVFRLAFDAGEEEMRDSN